MVLAIAAPALAQQVAEPTTPSSAADAIQTPAPVNAEAAAPAQAATPAQAAAATTPTDPASILKNEFPAYDKDKSGELSQVEFSAWMNALKAANPQKTVLTPEQETAWLDKSFADADKDKTKSITLAELTSYLTQQS